jgi:hypothetical protein
MKKTILCAAALLLFLHGVAGMSNAADSRNIFGLEVGNVWIYQGIGNDGPYTAHDEVVTTQSHMSRKLYVIKRREKGVWTETQWLEREPGIVKLWGGTAHIDGATYTMQFSTGLVQAWYPMDVGDSRFTATTLIIPELPGHAYNASMNVDVVRKKQIVRSNSTITAYKIRYQMRIWGNGADKTTTFVQWSVPYLGYVKYVDQDSTNTLSSFSVSGGNITQDTAGIKDGFKDCQGF